MQWKTGATPIGLGYHIDKGGLHPLPDKVQVVVEAPRPQLARVRAENKPGLTDLLWQISPRCFHSVSVIVPVVEGVTVGLDSQGKEGIRSDEGQTGHPDCMSSQMLCRLNSGF